MEHFNRNKNQNFCFLIVFLIVAGCDDARGPGFANINPQYLTCVAIECHNATQLRVYPPISGRHFTHLGLGEEGPSLGCEACHYQYYTNPQHKNGFVNGFFWIYNTRMPGNIVIFGLSATGAVWDPTTGNCTPPCHGIENWYSGGGG